jgi:hypothetical protein
MTLALQGVAVPAGGETTGYSNSHLAFCLFTHRVAPRIKSHRLFFGLT